MSTFLGTCYFESEKAAIEYFLKEGNDEASAKEYIKEGLVSIGPPPHTNLDDLEVKEGRYWKKEEK